ncbi:MAG TPA: hypothetical protein VFH51_07265 [Myxococcota bacterium]|nr:hypothetical protein [Myxococcota bacterium]
MSPLIVILALQLSGLDLERRPSEAAAIGDAWRQVFSGPHERAAAMVLDLGRAFAPSGVGRAPGTWHAGVSLPLPLNDWFAVVPAVDYSGNSRAAGALLVHTRALTFATRFGLARWAGPFRLDTMAELGVTRQTTRVRHRADAHGVATWQAHPGVTGGAAVGIGEAFLLGTRVTSRWLPQGWSHAATLEVGTLF